MIDKDEVKIGDIVRMKNFHHTQDGVTVYFKRKNKKGVAIFMYLGGRG